MNRGVGHPAVPGNDWPAIRKRLVAFARRKGLTREDAEQVAQEAIGRVFDPAYAPYDADLHGDLLRFLGSVVNGMISNLRKRRSYTPLSMQAVSAVVETAPSPEDHAIAREQAREVVDVLVERTADDPIAHRILTLIEEGVITPIEQAARLGVPIAEIYKAKRRLKTHCAAIRKASGGN